MEGTKPGTESDCEKNPSPRETWTFSIRVPTTTLSPLHPRPAPQPLAHLDAEASQHGVGVEQVSDGVVDVAEQGRVGDRGPQGVEGLLQEP